MANAMNEFNRTFYENINMIIYNYSISQIKLLDLLIPNYHSDVLFTPSTIDISTNPLFRSIPYRHTLYKSYKQRNLTFIDMESNNKQWNQMVHPWIAEYLGAIYGFAI